MVTAKRKDDKGRNLRTGECQRKDGRYMYRWTDNGKERSIYAATLAELREKETALQNDLRDGIDSRKANNTTLNDMFLEYMAGKTELKQTTRVNYKTMYKRYVWDTLGKHKISNIKYSDIKKFYSSLINEKGLKLGTVSALHIVLHPIFMLGVRDGIIRTNPADRVMTELKKAHNNEKAKRHALTIEEQTAFIGHIKSSPVFYHWLPIFTFLLGTGCRVGEAIGLRWEDIDFKNNTVSINHNLQYKEHEDGGNFKKFITTPKTIAGQRTIPMLSEVRQVLLEERKNQLKNGGSCETIDGYTNFIFLNRLKCTHSTAALDKAINRIVRDYNAKETAKATAENREPALIRHFSVHNLRHTFCTRFCENETNLKTIQEIMGHSNISTTMDIYAEATEAAKQEAFKNLDGKIKIG